MLFVYIWLYTFVLAIVWAFFIVTKMHSYKFKNFSNNIRKVTTVLFLVLLILSILWYVLIFFLDGVGSNTSKIDIDSNFEETYY